MKLKLLAFSFCFFVSMATLYAQSDYVMLGSRQYAVLDRFEVMLQKDSVLNFSAIKPFSRKVITERLEYIKELAQQGKISLSKADKYNIEVILKDNFEYSKAFSGKDTSLKFKDIFSKSVLKNPPYVGVKRGDFSLYATTYLNLSMGKDNQLSNNLFNNARGIYVRGTVTKNLGYYTYLTENQERDPLYVQQFEQKFGAVPGEGYYKSGFKGNGYDLFNARGGIMFNAGKGVDMQFAYDKVFIGNGYRSLILSDFSNNFLFFKINTRLWKFNYHLLYAQLVRTHRRTTDYLRPQKYMAYHQLDIQATKWLQIGLYENIMFGRSNGFDLSYLNPVIFYRAAEIQNGSPDKVTIGLNIKANVMKKTQLYGQFVLNEFLLSAITNYSSGSHVNKQALQVGGKSIDVFGIKNLDVQAEMNIIRPFVYSHWDTAGSFTHYNQPLAHPLGANLREYIGILRYQPIPKLQLQAKVIAYKQGLDSAGRNFGSSPFRLYTDRPRNEGFFIGSGIPVNTLIASFTATYELLPNLFLDANTTIRNYKKQGAVDFNTGIYSFGLRLNLQRREFDF
ncbi:MAG: hypothetical protein ACOVNY_08215 [Chitinophagaceae bacterium]